MDKKKINNYIPYIGDSRYHNLEHKFALDVIRVKYYLKYHKDPSITPLNDIVPLYDHTFQATGTSYIIRGACTFKIFLNNHKDCKENPNTDIMIEVNKDQFTDDNIVFMYGLIKLFSGNNANFIAGDLRNKNYVIGYISKKRHFNILNPLYCFISEFCDNNWRNIVYIGDDLKEGISEEEINHVNEDFIVFHQKGICEYLNISEDDFNEKYLSINKQLLKLIK